MTPLESYPRLAAQIGFPSISFKREDLHPYGSHKGRSIPVMIDHYYAQGERRFALSSSGNAALAAALHVRSKVQTSTGATDTDRLLLDIFISNRVNKNKLARIQRIADEVNTIAPETIRVLTKERPLQALTQAAQEGMRSLRQSTDDVALEGYMSLAEELITDSKKEPVGAVFIGTSSGTTAQALALYFSKKKSPIQVHIVQTSSCHPIADAFDTYDGPDEVSVADAIVDQTAFRKNKLVSLVEHSGGRAWVATNEDIRAAQEIAEKHADLDISTNSALSVVGAMKAAYTGHEIDGAVVCMICGE